MARPGQLGRVSWGPLPDPCPITALAPALEQRARAAGEGTVASRRGTAVYQRKGQGPRGLAQI